MAWAKHIIDGVFVPKLEKMIESLNAVLAQKGIRAGIEIIWRFDKEEKDAE